MSLELNTSFKKKKKNEVSALMKILSFRGMISKRKRTRCTVKVDRCTKNYIGSLISTQKNQNQNYISGVGIKN